MGIKFYDSNGKYWGEYDETRNLFIPSEEPITKTETQNSNLTFETPQTDECEGCKHYVYQLGCTHHATCEYEPKDTPQTESTGSPIGDYRDGVGAWQTDCPWK